MGSYACMSKSLTSPLRGKRESYLAGHYGAFICAGSSGDEEKFARSLWSKTKLPPFLWVKHRACCFTVHMVTLLLLKPELKLPVIQSVAKWCTWGFSQTDQATSNIIPPVFLYKYNSLGRSAVTTTWSIWSHQPHS